jgi:hypothetical protein
MEVVADSDVLELLGETSAEEWLVGSTWMVVPSLVVETGELGRGDTGIGVVGAVVVDDPMLLVVGNTTTDVLEGAVLEGAVLEGAVLEGDVLEGAVLEGDVLEGAVLEGAVLEGDVLEGDVLEGAVLEREVLDDGYGS